MNFISRFTDFCKRFDEPTIDKKYIVYEIRHNIHKRSLPVKIDQPIMWGLTEKEAQFILSKILKTKMTENADEKYITYYDMVREDGIRSSVYDNPPGVVVQESSNDQFDNWITH